MLFKGKYTYAVHGKEEVSATVCRISLCNSPITESVKPSIIFSVLQAIGNGRPEKASLERECTSTHLHGNHIEKGVQSQGTQSLSLARITARLESKCLLTVVPFNFSYSPLLLSMGSLRNHNEPTMAGAGSQQVRIIMATFRLPRRRWKRQALYWGSQSECACVWLCVHMHTYLYMYQWSCTWDQLSHLHFSGLLPERARELCAHQISKWDIIWVVAKRAIS